MELLLISAIIDLSDMTLTLPSGTVIPVGIGAQSTPTPVGIYSVERKVKDPHGQFYGDYAILLDKGNIGIHGTNNQNSIGQQSSLGCIRVPAWAEEQMFKEITWFTTVEIQQ